MCQPNWLKCICFSFGITKFFLYHISLLLSTIVLVWKMGFNRPWNLLYKVNRCLARYSKRKQKFWYPHLGTMVALFFGQAWEEMGQKCQYLAQNDQICIFWAKFGRFWAKHPNPYGRKQKFGFWSSTGPNGQKMPIFGPKWPKIPILGQIWPFLGQIS